MKIFTYLGGLACIGLYFFTPKTLELGVILFALAAIGWIGGALFYNSYLPEIASPDQQDKVSSKGFAFGYLGGLVALVLMLALFAENATTGKTLIGIDPIFGLDTEAREGTRMVGPLAALWYTVFMIPFFLWVREPRIAGVGRIHIGAALGSLRDFIAGLRFRKSLSAYLVSALLYRDALNGLYAFGGVYASNVLGWSITQIGVFGILGALTAVVASWIGGRLDKRFGPKPVLIGAMIILIAVCIVIVGLSRDSLYGIPLDEAGSTADIIFYICGALIGGAGGPLQAASRTMLVRHTTPDRATEAFGMFALSGKVASFISPLMIAMVTHISGSARIGISPVVLLFVLGLVLLIWVRPKGEMA